MGNRKLVVIGGDAAGMTSASKIRREQPDREIIVFERGHHTSYAACGIPYYLAKQVESEEHLVARKLEEFIEKQQIDVRIRHEVTGIDVRNKQVTMRHKLRYLIRNFKNTPSWPYPDQRSLRRQPKQLMNYLASGPIR